MKFENRLPTFCSSWRDESIDVLDLDVNLKLKEKYWKKLFGQTDRQTDSPINFFYNVTSTAKISA